MQYGRIRIIRSATNVEAVAARAVLGFSQEEGMKRSFAILALACFVLIFPDSMVASARAGNQLPPGPMMPGAEQPAPGGDSGDLADGVFEAQGDPDELGGGFRNSAKPPMNSNDKAGSDGRDILDSLVRLVLRLL
jgi:hypothetical protein